MFFLDLLQRVNNENDVLFVTTAVASALTGKRKVEKNVGEESVVSKFVSGKR